MFKNEDKSCLTATNCQSMTSRPRIEKVAGTLPLVSPRGTLNVNRKISFTKCKSTRVRRTFLFVLLAFYL